MDPKAIMLKVVMDMVLRMATPELIEEIADKILDFLEETVVKSSNKIDDKFLPLLTTIRETFNIKD